MNPVVRRVPGYRDHIESWRDKFRGKRCFILGNGPSLKEMDLSVLKDEITIGCNGIYKNFDEWGWKVNYLLFEDIEQTELRRRDIPQIHGPIKLAGLHNAYAFAADRDTYFMNVRNLDVRFLQSLFPQFSVDFSHQVHLASTVVYIGLQLAFHLGCDPVYLIGVDHNYGELPRIFPPCKITVTEDNIHLVRGLHVNEDYYQVGDTIGVPSVDYMEAGYAKAREVFESRGRRIFNAGQNSALDIFEKTDFADLFCKATVPRARKSEAPKVLFISHDAGRLGAQVLLLSLIHEFVHRYGWDCRVIVREANGTLIPDFESEATTDVFWPDPKSKQFGAHQEEIQRKMAEWGPDLVYSNTTCNGDVIAHLSSNAPVLVHTHELEWYLSLLDEARHTIFIEKTDLHIACSQVVKRNLVKNHSVKEDQIEVVYEAIDFERLRQKVTDTSTQDVRVQLGIPASAVLVGNCGRIDERKGWDLFIQMAERVVAAESEEHPVHFVWIGHGPNHQDLLKEAVQRGIGDRVHAPGPKENPFPFLAAMDIEVMCSRDDPFPLVVMEAAFLGCPVIAFRDAGGAPEFIRDDCGIVVEEISAQALAEAVNTLVHNESLRDRLGKNAHARAASEFDIRNASAQVARILHERLGLPLPQELLERGKIDGKVESPPGQRTLQFPNERSLGKLQVRDWGSARWEWQDLGLAQGGVQVPAAKEAYLIFDPAIKSLSALADLGPFDLQSLSIAGVPVTDMQLEHLRCLSGLRTLDLRRVPITDAAIQTLKQLPSLRSIALPPQLNSAARAELARALPNTNIQIDSVPATSPHLHGACPVGARHIVFPDQTFGLLMTRPWDLPIWNWVELGPARGTVHVPANQELLLVVFPQWKDDLSPLSKLAKDDLQGLHLRAAPIRDEQLVHIECLEGLRTLDLRDTKITAAGVTRLTALRNAVRIWLPTSISNRAREELSESLPDCRVQ